MNQAIEKKILITGAAGFIGFHLSQRLLERGYQVVGLDNLSDYYDVSLKQGRLQRLGIESLPGANRMVDSSTNRHFRFVQMDLADWSNIRRLFEDEQFPLVCNLAAQPGVRYSLKNPHAYVESNINGFINILEGARHYGTKHLVYASSSSVYGLNQKLPFSTRDNVDHPISLYAASKKSNELMAHTYSHLYAIPTTGLRFFTVYGPWGRPDMALFLFVKNILEGKPIDVFNNGDLQRDFTYIDDIVEGIVRCLEKVPEGNMQWSGENPDPATSHAPYKIYNIGNGNPVSLMDFILAIENRLGKKAILNMLPMQDGDMARTWADATDLKNDTGYQPATELAVGVGNFVDWYLEYFGKKI